MKSIIRKICLLLGFITLGIGAIGIILPILPTTPFLLLATFFFAKGSNRFHRWFLETNLYKKYIADAFGKKRMTVEARRKMMFTLAIIFTIAFVLCPIWHARALILIVALGHLYYFVFVVKSDKDVKQKSEIAANNR